MMEKPAEAPVRIIGSRELHQNLTSIIRELEDAETQFILTVHGKPKGVLVGAETCLNFLRALPEAGESLLGLQLKALMGRSIDRPGPREP